VYEPRLELKVGIVVDVYAQWLFSMLGVASSLSVCCRAITMLLMQTSFHNLRKVFSISRSTCTFSWSVDQVAGINSQQNSNNLKINQSKEILNSESK
jgi:hypothetical protein